MSPFDKEKLKEWGVVDFGYTTKSSPVSVHKYNLWVKDLNHLPLGYLEGERLIKRQDLKAYWSEFESAVVFLFSYHKAHQKLQSFYQKDPSWNGLKLASYTLGFGGLDYHEKINETLVEIAENLKATYGPLEYKICLDTQPVLERDLALRAGLGWFGKNSMLINRHHGSFFIIGSLLLNKKLIDEKFPERFQEPFMETDHCGECSRCVDSCPTMAIDPVSRTVKAIDCISTFTIEQFKPDSIAGEKMSLKEGFIFGCDICQDVCPWNKKQDKENSSENLVFTGEKETQIIDLFLKTEVVDLSQKISSLSEGAFRRLFKKTSFERSGRRGILKNLIFFLKD